MLRSIMAVCAFAASAALIAPAFAAGLASLRDVTAAPARVELLPGWREVSGRSVRHIFGFRITLADGWKTYWRAPGDDGIPPSVTWTMLSNAADPQMHFPRPGLIVDEDAGVSVIGYKDSVVFPVAVSVADPGHVSLVAGSFEYGVCRDVCIPERAEFRAELAADLNIMIDEITMARSSVPDRVDAAGSGLRFTCRFRPTGSNEFQLSAEIETGLMPPAQLAAVPEYPDPQIWFSDLDTELARDGTVRLSARMAHLDGHLPAIDRSKLYVTVVTAQSATEYTGCRSSS